MGIKLHSRDSRKHGAQHNTQARGSSRRQISTVNTQAGRTASAATARGQARQTAVETGKRTTTAARFSRGEEEEREE
jgi:hypothetical protein